MEWGYAFYWVFVGLSYFFVQLVVAEGMCVYRLKRRKFFLLRLLGSFAVGFGALVIMAIVGAALSPYFMAGTLPYVFVFAYTLVALWLCFDEPFTTLLFCGIAAYSVQNLAYRVVGILEVSGAIYASSHAIGYDAAYQILSAVAYIAVYAALYFAFIRNMQKRLSARASNKNVTIIAAVTLVITVFLCAWTNSYSWQHQYLLIINYLFSIICCLFILAEQSGMLERSELRRDIDIVNQMWEHDRRQYEISKESMLQMNVLCHDLKHKIKKLRLEECGLSEEELSQLEKTIAVYDCRVKTGCDPLDVILTEKSLYCNKNGIKFTCLANGAAVSFIGASDLYSLFGNILSNAIDAVSRIDDEERRSVNLTVREAGGMAVVLAENFYDGEIRFKEGMPQTQKGGAHGYGMKSIKMLAEKYGGETSCTASGGVFRLSLMLPIPQKN